MQLLPDAPARGIPLLTLDEVDLAYDHEDAAHVEKLQNLQMLDRLRHHAFVGVDDQQQELHAGCASQHIVQETLVAGHVDDAAFDTVVET